MECTVPSRCDRQCPNPTHSFSLAKLTYPGQIRLRWITACPPTNHMPKRLLFEPRTTQYHCFTTQECHRSSHSKPAKPHRHWSSWSGTIYFCVALDLDQHTAFSLRTEPKHLPFQKSASKSYKYHETMIPDRQTYQISSPLPVKDPWPRESHTRLDHHRTFRLHYVPVFSSPFSFLRAFHSTQITTSPINRHLHSSYILR